MSTFGLFVLLLNIVLQFAVLSAVCWFVLSNWLNNQRLIIASTASAAFLMIIGSLTTDFLRQDRPYTIGLTIAVAVAGTFLWLRRHQRNLENHHG